MRVALVYNPGAGHSGPSIEQLRELLGQFGYDAQLLNPKDRGLAEHLTGGFGLVVAAGGDGTVTKVAMALPADGPCMTILPFGTANNIATALGIRGRAADLVSAWANAPQRRIDIWTATGPWGSRRFIEGCGLGALTRAAHQMDNHEISGPSSGQEIAIARAALLQSLMHNDPIEAEVTMDGERMTERFLLLEALNFGSVGPRLLLAVDADPSDGLLDIGCATEHQYNPLCAWLSEMAAGPAPLQLRRCHELRIRWHNARFRIGDKYWPKTGRPEPDDAFEANISLAAPGPRVLVSSDGDATNSPAESD